MGEIFKQSRHNTELSSLLDTVWDSKHQLECIAIYPESLGNEELERIACPLKAALIQRGFSLKTISEESIIKGHLEKSALDAVLYVLLLKGNGPGLQYSYGFLKGKGKFVLNIRDLSNEKAESHNSQKELDGIQNVGVDENCINITSKTELSIGKSIEVDKGLGKFLPEIIESYVSERISTFQDLSSEQNSQLNNIGIEALHSYSGIDRIELDAINEIYKRAIDWQDTSGKEVPAFILAAVSSLYSESFVWEHKTKSEYEKALNNTREIYEILSASDLVKETRQVCTIKIADTLLSLHVLSGNREHIEKAVKIYKDTLADLGQENQPGLKLYVNSRLGEAYSTLADLSSEDQEKFEHLEKSLEYIDSALSLKGSAEVPALCGKLLELKGQSLLSLGEGEQSSDRLNLSIDALFESLKFCNLEKSPELLAEIQLTLASAYRAKAIFDESTEECILAIESFERALLYYSENDDRENIAYVQSQLGACYDLLAQLDHSEESRLDAIGCYQESIKFYSIPDYPQEYAHAQYNLGNAYSALGELCDKENNSESALSSYLEALKVYTVENNPYEYAKTKNNIGVTYSALAEIKNTKENAFNAASAFREAAGVIIDSDYKLELGMISNNLGDSYSVLASEDDKAQNLILAEEAYNQALSVYEESGDFIVSSLLKKKLGDVNYKLSELIDYEDRAIRARDCYAGALESYNKDEQPYEYAQIRTNLGRLHSRICVNEDYPARSAEIIEAYEDALSIFNENEYPDEYQKLKLYIGDAFFELSRFAELVLNTEKAISNYEDALIVSKSNDKSCALILNKVGMCRTTLAKQRESVQEFEKAVKDFEDALNLSCQDHIIYPAIVNNLGAAHCMAEQFSNNIKHAELGFNSLVSAVPAIENSLVEEGSHNEILAASLLNLGAVYNRINTPGSTAQNLKKSIEYLEKALSIINAEQYQSLYAQIKNSLGCSYIRLAEIEDAEKNCEFAIESFKEVNGVFNENDILKSSIVCTNLGNAYLSYSEIGKSGERIELALKSFYEALDKAKSISQHNRCASIKSAIARAFSKKASFGNHTENYGSAIDMYEDTLSVYTKEKDPWQYRATKKNIGLLKILTCEYVKDESECEALALGAVESLEEWVSCFSPNLNSEYGAVMAAMGDAHMILNSLIEDYEHELSAVHCYEKSLSCFPAENYSEHYLELIQRLESIYDGAGENEYIKSTELIGFYQKALLAYKFDIYPYEYALTNMKLGRAYVGEKNFDSAIQALEQSLRGYSVMNAQEEQAQVNKELGDLYTDIARASGSPEHYRRAITCFDESIKYFTAKSHPEIYGEIKKSLGAAYGALADGQDGDENYLRELESYNKALGVFTQEEYSEEYRDLKKRMGGVYAMLGGAKGELGEYQGALEHYEEALSVFTLEEFPEEYGKYKHELARLMENQGKTNSDFNIIGDAIKAYQELAAFYKPDENEQKHEEILDTTKALYKFLGEFEVVEGESGRNQIEQVLTICTKQQAPYEHALLQMKLGDSYSGYSEQSGAAGNKALLSLEELKHAFESYETALGIYDEDNYPKERAFINFRLGAVSSSISGLEEQENNLLKSKDYYSEGIKFYTESDHPKQHQEGCSEIAEIYKSLAGISIDTGELNSALDNLNKAKSYYGKAGLSDEALNVTRQTGDLYLKLSESGDKLPNLQTAAECYEEFLAQNSNNIDQESGAELTKALVEIYRELTAKSEPGIYLKTIDHAKKSLQWFTKEKDIYKYVWLNHVIAEASHRMSNHEDRLRWLNETVSSCREALSVCDSIEYEGQSTLTTLITNTYVDIGKEFEGSGDLHNSASNYILALDLYQAGNDADSKAGLCSLLGDIYKKLTQSEDAADNSKTAIDYYSRAHELFKNSGNEPRCTEIEGNIQQIYELLGEQECESEDAYLQILDICTKEKCPLQHAIIRARLGMFYRSQLELGENDAIAQNAFQNYDEAIGIYESQSLDIEKNEVIAERAHLINIISDWKIEEAEYEDALSGYREALNIFDNLELGQEYSDTEVKIGSLYVKRAEQYQKEVSQSGGARDFEKCVDEYMNALGIFCEARNPQEFATVHMKLSSIYLAIGEHESDLEYYNKAIGSCREAIRIFSPEDYPERHMEIQNNIVKAYEAITELKDKQVKESQNTVTPPEPVQRNDEKPLLQVVKTEEQEDIDLLGEIDVELLIDGEDTDDQETAAQAVMAKAASGDSGVDAVFDEPEFSDSNQEIDYYTKALLTETAESSPERYGWIKSKLGGLYTEVARNTGSASNFRRAVKSYEESLEIYSSERYPEQYGRVQKSIAESLRLFAEQSGELKSYRRALESYKNALKVFQINTNPRAYGFLYMNIGGIYYDMAEISGDAEEYENAISSYEQALRVFNAVDFPSEYGSIQRRRGIAYGILAEVDSDVEKYRKAVNAYTEALTCYSYESAPEEYGEISKFLGIAYDNLAEESGDTDLLRKAQESYKKALEFYSEDRGLSDYSLIQKNLGSSYEKLSEKEQTPDSAVLAIQAFNEAIKYYKRDNISSEYASIESSLGGLYKTVSETDDKVKNLRRSIESYEEVTKVFNIKEFPLEYAATQNNIGIVFRTLAEAEDKGKNCKRAVNAYKEALKIYSRSSYPQQYGSTQTNLGSAYRTLAEVEDKEANCRHALRAFEEALKVRTIREHPLQFAATQNNLGVVYRTLGDKEDRAKNTKKAIDAYETALIIYSIDKYPIQYASTQNNIGAAYTTLAEVVDKEDNCKKAIYAYTEALKIFTEERFPGPHKLVSTNLNLLKEFCKSDS